MGQGLEDRPRAGAKTSAGVVCWLGGGCLGLGLVVWLFMGASSTAFPGLMASGFQVLLLGPPFSEVSDPIGFLFPAGTEPGARVGGAVLGVPVPKAGTTTVADGRVALVEPELEAGDRGKITDWGGLWVLVWVKTGLLAWLVSLASIWATVGVDLEELALGGRGRVLSGRGRGVMGFHWMGFTVGPETLAGVKRGVDGAGFWVDGADFMNEWGAAFWAGWGLLAGATEGEGAEGLVGRLLEILVAVIFCNGWAATGWALVRPAGEAGAEEGGALLAADSLAGGDGVWAGPLPAACW